MYNCWKFHFEKIPQSVLPSTHLTQKQMYWTNKNVCFYLSIFNGRLFIIVFVWGGGFYSDVLNVTLTIVETNRPINVSKMPASFDGIAHAKCELWPIEVNDPSDNKQNPPFFHFQRSQPLISFGAGQPNTFFLLFYSSFGQRHIVINFQGLLPFSAKPYKANSIEMHTYHNEFTILMWLFIHIWFLLLLVCFIPFHHHCNSNPLLSILSILLVS